MALNILPPANPDAVVIEKLDEQRSSTSTQSDEVQKVGRYQFLGFYDERQLEDQTSSTLNNDYVGRYQFLGFR